MKIYAAGTYSASLFKGSRLFVDVLNDRERKVILEHEHFLESYHYCSNPRLADVIAADGRPVFLDSGAFSAFTLGKQIDLRAYCEYIKTRSTMLEVVSVLDGIGDPLKTYKNQKAMEGLGVNPLPCFHYGEDERYLEWYLDNYDHITLGGMVPISNRDCKVWLDRIWGKYLTNEDGSARIKVHGFGMTSMELIYRYPWYSVDSSTWVQAANFGQIMFFMGDSLIRVSISNDSPSRKKAQSHIMTYDSTTKEAIMAEVESNGFTVERLSSLYASRWTYNILMFQKIEQSTRQTFFKTRQMDIFG